MIIMPLLAFVSVVVGIAVGSSFIPFVDVLKVISHKIFGTDISGVSAIALATIWEIRLPRVVFAFLTGAAVSTSGAVIQSVLRNPLASPYTLGVSSGASLGAGIIFVTGLTLPVLSAFTLPLAGLVFGLGTVVLCIAFVTKIDRNLESTTIVLCGMVLSLFINAIFTLISTLSKDKMYIIIKWQLGTFGSKRWDFIGILATVLAISLIVLIFFSRELDLLTFGEEQAGAIGVETKKVKWLLLCVSSVLAGTAVAFAGVIGFIDLISPHIVRKLFTSKHRYLVFLSSMFGGIFMIVADLISRTVLSPREIPVGCITALIGAPFFAYVFFKRRRK